MEEKKDTQKRFSTCMEGVPFAEMMKKMMGQQGIGSLCHEMMKKSTGQQGIGSLCHEMMKNTTGQQEVGSLCAKLMKKCSAVKEKFEDAKEEEGHGREE